jgi:type I site-specific restriction endonuclease
LIRFALIVTDDGHRSIYRLWRQVLRSISTPRSVPFGSDH